MQKSIFIPTSECMLDFGMMLGGLLQSGDIVYLHGDLGAGKTTLARGMLRSLGHEGVVKSPTFTLVEPYHLSHYAVFHFDLYRIKHSSELVDMGIADYFAADSIVLVEWPENAASLLPPATLTLHIHHQENGREIQLCAETKRGIVILSQIS